MKCIAKIHAAKGGGLPTFEGLAYTGVDMQPMGWGGRVVIDLAGVVIPNQHRPVLRQHDPEKIAGHTTKVDVHRTKGITVAGVFSGQPEHVNAVVVPAKNGFQWQMSIGADPLEISYLDAGKETKVNGRTVAGPLAISRRTVLGEVSFVPLGADGATSAYVNAKHAHKLLAAATPAQCWSIGERDDGDIDIKALTRQIMAEARDDMRRQAKATRRQSFTGGIRALAVPYNRKRSMNGQGCEITMGFPLLYAPGAFTESVNAIMAGNEPCGLFLGHGSGCGDIPITERHFELTDAADGVYIRMRRRRAMMNLLRAFPSCRSISATPILREYHVTRDNLGAYYVCTRADLEHIAVVERPVFSGTGFSI